MGGHSVFAEEHVKKIRQLNILMPKMKYLDFKPDEKVMSHLMSKIPTKMEIPAKGESRKRTNGSGRRKMSSKLFLPFLTEL